MDKVRFKTQSANYTNNGMPNTVFIDSAEQLSIKQSM